MDWSGNQKLNNVIRMYLKREVETFSGRTEDFNLTYVSWNWGLHIITDKIEDFFGKKLKYNERHTNRIIT